MAAGALRVGLRASAGAGPTMLTKVYYPSSGPFRHNIFSVEVTGGGSGAIQQLFTTPGASQSVRSAGVPYSREALDALL